LRRGARPSPEEPGCGSASKGCLSRKEDTSCMLEVRESIFGRAEETLLIKSAARKRRNLVSWDIPRDRVIATDKIPKCLDWAGGGRVIVAFSMKRGRLQGKRTSPYQAVV